MTHRRKCYVVSGGRNWQVVDQRLAVLFISFAICGISSIIPPDKALGSAPGRRWQSSQKPPAAGGVAGEEKDVRRLEPGQPIRRELEGGQEQGYRIGLSAGQYLEVIVKQQGIDVIVLLSGPDGKQGGQGNQNWEFDNESRLQGQEVAPLVAEVTGEYRLMVRPRQKDARAGGYEIRIEELRAATEIDRELQEARKLSKEARRLQLAGKYDEALRLGERALEIREKRLGPDHLEVARSLNNLAHIYYLRGDYAKAEPLYQRALVIREKALGPDHLEVADSLNSLSTLYWVKGDYAKSELLQQRALAIREKVLGPDHPDLATSLNNVAGIYNFKGDYAKAEQLYQRSLAIREKALGPDHPGLASSLSNLALLYSDRGDYNRADLLYQRSLAIREKALGPDHQDVAISLHNLALNYSRRGDYAKAEPLYRRALAIWEKALGPDHPNVALSLDNLANLYHDEGDDTRAELLQQRALAIREKVLGPDHLDVAKSLNNLANIYHGIGDYAKAEPLYRRVLTISEKTLGPEHFGVAYGLNNLGRLHLDKGEYAEAEPMLQRALAIWEKTLRPEHPFIAESLTNLAVLCEINGDLAQAVRLQSRANTISEYNLAFNLRSGSERQKLAYLALFSAQTDSTLSLHTQVAPNDPQALDLAFTTWLRRKGRGLEAMADTIAILRRHAAPQDQQLFDQLADARSQLAALTLGESSTAKPGTYRAQLASLREKADELEATLSSHSAEFRTQSQPVALAAVQSALPAGSVLVEFAAYRPHELPTEKRKPPRYLAYLLAPQGRPQWVDLGEIEVIDRAVEAWRRALRDPRRTDVKQLARGMDDKVMRPVRALLQSGLGEMRGKIRRLLIAPDGSLNLIPFAALVDEQGRYLVERYSISYLVSGRDLLRLQVRQPSKSEAVVVADPDYGETVVAAQSKRRDVGLPSGMPQTAGSNVSLSQVYFPPLRGTAGEARALKAMLPQATVLTGERATEARLKQLSSPKILHLATHGFFLRDQDPNSPVEISLLRSGLALAGANLRRGGPDPADDGILTALEAAGLDLWGTKLVVLSACDTGVGEVKVGEGVYGLRRALALAGAETQVMSLWPVSDTGTRDLMIGYYKALKRGEGRGEGLRRVQLEMIKSKDRRHPFYWAGFIQSGEWANLEGTR